MFVTQNAYPREALLEALLRFVEEDLAAAGPRAALASSACGATVLRKGAICDVGSQGDFG